MKVKTLSQKKKAMQRYYIHRKLKKHGLLVLGRYRTISAKANTYEALPKSMQNHISTLIKIGYNIQFEI